MSKSTCTFTKTSYETDYGNSMILQDMGSKCYLKQAKFVFDQIFRGVKSIYSAASNQYIPRRQINKRMVFK